MPPINVRSVEKAVSTIGGDFGATCDEVTKYFKRRFPSMTRSEVSRKVKLNLKRLVTNGHVIRREYSVRYLVSQEVELTLTGETRNKYSSTKPRDRRTGKVGKV